MPAEIPVTTPVPAPTVATEVLALFQMPPAAASVSVVVAPTQKFVAPVIAGGIGLTVTIVVAAHPAALV